MIITALAILIAVAGYLNFSDVNLGFRDKEASTDSSSILDEVEYDLTDETALQEENGAAGGWRNTDACRYTGRSSTYMQHQILQHRQNLSREQVRSQNKADLQEIINNTDIGDEQKQQAVNTMVEMTDIAEKEAAAEMLLEAKGFENVIVNLTGETADVVVPDTDLEDAKRAQIEDIIKRKTGIAPANIVITPLSQTEENEGESEESSSDETYQEEETGAAVSTDGTASDTGGEQETSTEPVIETEGIYD